MIKIRRVCSCIRLSNCRQSRLRLYLTFTSIVVCFSLITIYLNVTHTSTSFSEQMEPSLPLFNLLPNKSPVIRRTDVLNGNNVQLFQTKKPNIRYHPDIGTDHQKNVSASSPPTNVWNTNLHYTDRIMEQLAYIPKNINVAKVMNILVYEKGGGEIIITGNDQFKNDKCLVSNCFLITNLSSTEHYDAVITSTPYGAIEQTFAAKRKSEDVWIYYNLESPYLSAGLGQSNEFNWTATYRHDSTIVAPYEKWVPYENGTNVEKFPETALSLNGTNFTHMNYSRGKIKMAAALISNCAAYSRWNIVRALSQHIQVDVYGACGLSCENECYNIIKRDYKFYLAFENANCADYITEKLFKNALSNDVLPVVFGAPPPDYLRSAPRYSYIHVDNFPSVLHLARYLKDLDKNDDLYNFYFKWKHTGSFINTKFWCRLCAMLNDLDKPRLMIPDISYWLMEKQCRDSSLAETETFL